MITLDILLLYLSVASFSMMVVTSSLAYQIKQLLGFTSTKIQKLTHVSFYTKLFGSSTATILSPFLFILIVLIHIHQFIKRILECPYCQSFHYSWLCTYFFFDMSFGYSLLFAPISIAFVIILNRLFID